MKAIKSRLLYNFFLNRLAGLKKEIFWAGGYCWPALISHLYLNSPFFLDQWPYNSRRIL